MKKITISVIDAALLALSLALCFGTKFAFHACAPKPDGSWMHCHQAELAVVAIGAALSLAAAARLFLRRGAVKAALSFVSFALAVVAALVPQVIIKLCMMQDMRCHAVMRPAVFVLGVLIAAVSLVDALVSVKAAAAGGRKAA